MNHRRLFISTSLTLGLAVSASHALAADDPAEKYFEKPYRVEAAGSFIDVDIGHAAPFIYDFDSDGKQDLLVGQFGEGKLRIYRNTGTNQSPKYTEHKWFKAEHEFGTVPSG